MEDHDDNIFDEDDALDFIMNEEVEKWDKQPQGKSGCLGMIVLTLLPANMLYWALVLFTK